LVLFKGQRHLEPDENIIIENSLLRHHEYSFLDWNYEEDEEEDFSGHGYKAVEEARKQRAFSRRG
jgi:hypothetical protein